ncbi:MAG: PD40 domain-containing protein, partial [Phycisphaerales bacterium]|nr:PD40 domain-containing protein [Phycisphaerales bacterium]
MRRAAPLFLALAAFSGSAFAERVTYPRQIALSPDGATLAFAWAGDIWTVPSTGGAARRLTIHPAHESSPVWSHDGRQIAFASDRYGSDNVYVMSADGDNIMRLTFSDRPETPTDFTRDNLEVYYQTRKAGEVPWLPRVYRVPVGGGAATRVMECGASDARISPDGSTIAFTRGGSRWWRTGYRGSANWDVWTCKIGESNADAAFTRWTTFDGTDASPIWNRDGSGVYFLSDRGGLHDVWFMPRGGAPRQITQVAGDRVREFAVSADESTLAYVKWDRVFVEKLPNGYAREVEIDAATDQPVDQYDRKNFTNDADELEASPKGDEIAIVVYGEIFVTSTEENKPTRRVTDSPARDRHVVWSPDGQALFFISDRDGQEDVYRAVSAEEPPKPLSESLRFRIDRVTDNPEYEQGPRVSPDGKQLAFVRGLGNLIVRDLKSGDESTLVHGFNWPTFQWSPDSEWIAYEIEDEEYNPDVWIVPADASKPAVNISRHPDADGGPQWSADGQLLAFVSQREGQNTDIYVAYLSPSLYELSEPDLYAYYEQAEKDAGKREPPKEVIASGKIRLAGEPAPAAEQSGDEEKKPEESKEAESIDQRLRTLLKEFLEGEKDDKKKAEEIKEDKPKREWDLDTAYLRLRRIVALPGDQSNYAMAPSGAEFVFVSRHEGDAAAYYTKWNGKDQKQAISGNVGALHFQLDGKRLFYLKGGTPGSAKATGGDSKTHRFAARMRIDRKAQAAQKFDDAARMLGMRFYHPTLKGLDWPALTSKYRDLALTTHTDEELGELFDQLQGHLNGSHLGYRGAGGGGGERLGYLGLEFDATYAGPGMRISRITPYGPATRGESKLSVGDTILAVNGAGVGPERDIEEALLDIVNEEVILRIRPAAEDGKESKDTEIVIRPIGGGEFRDLEYEAWVAANRRYVEDKSGGRVGYVHIRGMDEGSFNVFERDLYAAAHGKDGLIVDVRNNGGGWTADWVMAVLNVRRHAYTIGRGGEPGYPQDRLIFYSWPKPATMMCNQFSYSNAEIVSH